MPNEFSITDKQVKAGSRPGALAMTNLAYSETEDNSDKEWSIMDLADLRWEMTHGGTIESAAKLLCRWHSRDDVRRKAVELGLI
jgi:hypothetical protein